MSLFSTIGSHGNEPREINDYYATDPKAIEFLLQLETFNTNIWEPACGEGHLSIPLQNVGYNVWSTDLVYRNYGTGPIDFLSTSTEWWGDIITNPPYKYCDRFVEKSIESLAKGLRLLFLEGQKRKKLFDEYPLKTLYVSSRRLTCAKNGDFQKYKRTALAHGWFVWEKGYTGESVIKWF